MCCENAVKSAQTCAGISGGIEASIHAMRKLYEDNQVEGILLVHASNAFNALNRKAALHNIQHTCPEFATYIRNIYRCDAELFISNSDQSILSKEDTTQGGPESMGFYAVSTIPLSQMVNVERARDGTVKNIFYADDGGGGGTLDELSCWWKDIQNQGPIFGYFPNSSKTWLIVKEQHLKRAKQLFPDTNVTTEGHKYLGSYIGSEDGTRKFVEKQIEDWSKDIDALINIASSEPQLAYSA